MAKFQKMRVLFVIPGEGQGNSMIFARREAESLAREGIEVECFYLRSRTSPRLLLNEFRRLRQRIRTFGAELVHAQYGTMTAAVAALAAGKLPLVITYRGGDLNRPRSDARARSILAHLLSQVAALFATRIVCVSRGLKQRLWWRGSRVSILPSGVDADRFRPEPRDQARDRLGWSLAEPVILFNAGGDAGNKRLDLAQRSAEVAREYVPALRLEVLDGGKDPKSIPDYMNASDCLLIASDSEGSPTVLQEALACALPVVSVDVGDAVERLRGVSYSRIVPRDPKVMGRALAAIAGARERSNGPQAVQGLTLRQSARSLERIYRDALGEPRIRAIAAAGRG
jgi:teichuronic acid biosynthesis glycosyltransferase TuaC